MTFAKEMICNSYITALAVVLSSLLGSCIHTSTYELDTHPHFLNPSPNHENLPREVVEDLPSRITALAEGRSLSIDQLVQRLGLSAYRSNVSADLIQQNTCLMYLDTNHFMVFTIDLSTLPSDLSLQIPWDARVIKFSMLKTGNVKVISKSLVKQ